MRDGTARAADRHLVHFRFGGRSAGAPMVFLHGWSGSAQDWNRELDSYGLHRPVVAIDLSRRAPSLDMYAADVRAVIEKLDLSEVTLIGRGSGAIVAIASALLLESRVQRVIALDLADQIFHEDTSRLVRELRVPLSDHL